FTTLYLTGTVPLAGLMANAISQKGDALIPLLGFDRRAALSTSLLTTVPALAVGGVVLLVAG
ncbi:putative manganese transporter, partial [Actinoalloteichus spitiensis]|uniref:putative manganese transporter n=1 Tax=Actinoalloteichus spitiensis TaxID=252394 RepID=UPI000585BB31